MNRTPGQFAILENDTRLLIQLERLDQCQEAVEDAILASSCLVLLWPLYSILFVGLYGEGDTRRISDGFVTSKEELLTAFKELILDVGTFDCTDNTVQSCINGHTIQPLPNTKLKLGYCHPAQRSR